MRWHANFRQTFCTILWATEQWQNKNEEELGSRDGGNIICMRCEYKSEAYNPIKFISLRIIYL